MIPRHFWLFPAAVSALLLFASCQKKPQEQNRPPANVSVITVEPQPARVLMEFTGTAEAMRHVQIRTRVDGYLQKQRYRDGQRVSKGKLLISIDPRPFEIALQQAQASLEQAKAQQQNADANFERIKPLFEQSAASRQEYDAATAALRIAKAQLQSAKASVAQAELNLEYTKIVSPISGIADRMLPHEGAYVSTQQNALLTTVYQVDPIWVNFSIGENDYLKLQEAVKSGTVVKNGAKPTVQISLSDGRKLEQKGVVEFSSPVLDPSTGTRALRATLPNPDASILPGQFVRVSMGDLEWQNALLVPQKALMQGQKGYFVYVAVSEIKAEQRPVKLGEWIGENVIIKEGLRDGERVIVDGTAKISPQGAIKIMPNVSQKSKESR